MAPDAERAYVRRWAEAGRLLDDQQCRELATLTHERAKAADALIEAALHVPLPEPPSGTARRRHRPYPRFSAESC